jgi:hypothetical protein
LGVCFRGVNGCIGGVRGHANGLSFRAWPILPTPSTFPSIVRSSQGSMTYHRLDERSSIMKRLRRRFLQATVAVLSVIAIAPPLPAQEDCNPCEVCPSYWPMRWVSGDGGISTINVRADHTGFCKWDCWMLGEDCDPPMNAAPSEDEVHILAAIQRSRLSGEAPPLSEVVAVLGGDNLRYISEREMVIALGTTECTKGEWVLAFKLRASDVGLAEREISQVLD